MDAPAAAALADGAARPGRAGAAGGGFALTAEYGQAIDRESAYERLLGKVAAPAAADATGATAASAPEQEQEHEHEGGGVGEKVGGVLGSPAFKAFSRSIGSALGREVTRSLFGTARRSPRRRR